MKIASKQYVDSIAAALSVQPDWNQANGAARNFIKNKPDLSDMATKSWVAEQGFLGNNGASGAGYAVLSNQKTGAVTDDEFWIDLDKIRFRAYKASQANYWGLRIVNNTGTPIEYGSRGMQQYSGVQMSNKGGILANGAEFNPDSETNDIGYSKDDVFITHFFDTTNMHLYRWTVHVSTNKAMMILERLH